MVCQTQCEAARGEPRGRAKDDKPAASKAMPDTHPMAKPAITGEVCTARAYASALLTGSLPTGAGEPG
jgi:hypothetical protein